MPPLQTRQVSIHCLVMRLPEARRVAALTYLGLDDRFGVIADLQTAAAAIAQEIEVFPADTSRDIAAAFEAVV